MIVNVEKIIYRKTDDSCGNLWWRRGKGVEADRPTIFH